MWLPTIPIRAAIPFDNGYFATGGVDNAPLHALANGVDGSNGVYRYGPSAFPTSSYNGSNYWVDVVFATTTTPDTTPPVVVSVNPAVDATIVPVECHGDGDLQRSDGPGEHRRHDA